MRSDLIRGLRPSAACSWNAHPSASRPLRTLRTVARRAAERDANAAPAADAGKEGASPEPSSSGTAMPPLPKRGFFSIADPKAEVGRRKRAPPLLPSRPASDHRPDGAHLACAGGGCGPQPQDPRTLSHSSRFSFKHRAACSRRCEARLTPRRPPKTQVYSKAGDAFDPAKKPDRWATPGSAAANIPLGLPMARRGGAWHLCGGNRRAAPASQGGCACQSERLRLPVST